MKYTNKLALPNVLYKAILNTQSNRNPTLGVYHVTELIRPAREILLTRKHWDELMTDISECTATLFGTAVHKIIELADPEHAEIKIEYQYKDITIKGCVDYVDPLTHEIYDWKTCRHTHTEEDNKQWYLQGMLYTLYFYLKDHIIPPSVTFFGLVKDYTTFLSTPPIYVYKFQPTQTDILFIMDYLNKKISQLKLPTLPECTEEEKWQEPTLYKVYKKGSTTRAIRTETFYPHDVDLTKYEIKIIPGKCVKCEHFCKVKKYC